MKRTAAFVVCLSVVLLASVGVQGQAGESCSTSDGGSGTCIDTSTTTCDIGILEDEGCPADSSYSLQCCVTDWGSCTANGQSGECVVTSDCSGTSVPGQCPGPSSVQCCVTGGGYNCQACDGDMCCNIPSNNEYFLTSFCDGYPHDETACGLYCDSMKYFSADSQRFGCGGVNLNICNQGGQCVTVQVIDAGPGSSVEEKAQMPIIDASPQVCMDLFNSNSCGWSDGNKITAVLTSRKQLGPFKVTPEEMKALVKEGDRLMRIHKAPWIQ